MEDARFDAERQTAEGTKSRARVRDVSPRDKASMQLLALNTAVPMRGKSQLAVGALPLLLLFASFAPLFVFATWLEAVLHIPANAPVKSAPNGGIAIATLIAVMLLFMLVGYTLGWVLNALIARLLLGWSIDEIRAVYLRSEIPAHWRKDQGSARLDGTARPRTDWAEVRKMGMARYVAIRGILTWGGAMFFAMYVVPTLARGRTLATGQTLSIMAIYALGGAAFGAAIWFLSESNHRKITKGR